MSHTRRKSWIPLAGATLLMAVLAGCGPTIPKVNSIKLGKDQDITKEITTFSPRETVYGVASISSPGKCTVKWQMFEEKVDGVPDNFHVTNGDASVELSNSGTSTYHFPPGDGFPVGKFRLEVHLLDEGGAEKDMKSTNFTVGNG